MSEFSLGSKILFGSLTAFIFYIFASLFINNSICYGDGITKTQECLNFINSIKIMKVIFPMLGFISTYLILSLMRQPITNIERKTAI